MSLASYLALAAAVFILALTPGPVMVATVARSLFSGLRPALGFVVGDRGGGLGGDALARFA